MQLDLEVIDVAGFARMTGRTEAAVAKAIQRGCRDMPVPFKMAGRWSWRVASVREWLEEAERGSEASLSRLRSG
jgi:predicted DNA-binding transcriptional regulator AlpA